MLLDTLMQTSLNTFPQGNPSCHFEVFNTSISGQETFIQTEPQPLDFDKGSEFTSGVDFRPFHIQQYNMIVTSLQIAFNLPLPQTALGYMYYLLNI